MSSPAGFTLFTHKKSQEANKHRYAKRCI